MGITTKTDEKILSELNLMVQVGATPVECVKALKGKMSHSSVYKFYNRFKIQAHHKAVGNAKEEKAVNVPSEVTKEPVSEVMNQAIEEQLEEDLKDGDIVDFEGKKYKFVETGEITFDDCKKCDLIDNYMNSKNCLCDEIKTEKGYFI